eukprot:IDg15818t1
MQCVRARSLVGAFQEFIVGDTPGVAMCSGQKPRVQSGAVSVIPRSSRSLLATPECDVSEAKIVYRYESCSTRESIRAVARCIRHCIRVQDSHLDVARVSKMSRRPVGAVLYALNRCGTYTRTPGYGCYLTRTRQLDSPRSVRFPHPTQGHRRLAHTP